MDSERLQACEKLLSQAYLSYVRHEEGRREPFNLFTVLRSESDEVRLHSRFLAALLDHRKAPDASRENLKHFLETVAKLGKKSTHKELKDDGTEDNALKTIAKGGGFKNDNILIDCERDNIDILITNDGKPNWAVAIENKIWAGDQPQQLLGYYEALIQKGYGNIVMLYLTLSGHEPTKDSVHRKLPEKCCKLPESHICYVPKNRLRLISYRDTLPSWLEGCQQRAYDEPELRGSVAQYLHLVRKLTGTDRRGKYMNELKAILLEKEDNLVLAHDLSKAIDEVKAHLVHELWKEIGSAIKRIEGFPVKSDEESEISLDAVRGYVKRRHNYSRLGLSYPAVPPGAAFGIDTARLCAEILGYMDQITIGLKFIGEKDDDDKQVEGLLGKLRSSSIKGNVEHHEKDTWLWWRCIDNGWGLRDPIADHLRTLLREDKRKKVASDVAQGLKEAWEAINT